MVKKSILASFLIGVSVVALLRIENSICGAFLFALGLTSVCFLEANLFTGKCGFTWKAKPVELIEILAINLVSGYAFGAIFRFVSPSIVEKAQEKISTWSFSIPFFLNAVLCGMTMYLAVALFKKHSSLGFLYVPLFILSGFQHCIANVIVCGIALSLSPSLILAVLGNFIGSVIVSFLSE